MQKSLFLQAFILANYFQLANLKCLPFQLSQARGNYRNVLDRIGGAILYPQKIIVFQGDQTQGNFLRDQIYNYDHEMGVQRVWTGQSMTIELLQAYELNVFKIWFWDKDERLYFAKVYLEYENVEKLIFSTKIGRGPMTIHFPDQKVKKFRILAEGGTPFNDHLSIVKVEAFYQVSEN